MCAAWTTQQIDTHESPSWVRHVITEAVQRSEGLVSASLTLGEYCDVPCHDGQGRNSREDKKSRSDLNHLQFLAT